VDDLAEYLRKRNQILLLLDIDGMLALMKENESPVPSNRQVALIAIHKARTGCTSLPMEARSISKQWLLEHSYLDHIPD
jgi:hypothetical protein